MRRVSAGMPPDLLERLEAWAKGKGMARATAIRALIEVGLEISDRKRLRQGLEDRRLTARVEKEELEARKRLAEALAAEADVFRGVEVLEMVGETCEVFRGELRGLPVRFRHVLEGAGVPTRAAETVLRDIEQQLVTGIEAAFSRGDPRNRQRNGEDRG